MIPVSFTFSGDESAAKMLRAAGLREMAKVEEFMGFQGLQQYRPRPVELAPGITVRASKIFGARHVHIHVEPGGGDEAGKKYICLCNCNFAFGIVTEEQDDPLSGDGSRLYTVLVCRNKRGYAIEKNVLASDFSPYLPGQKVLVAPYYLMEFKCCNNVQVATGCSPVRSEEGIDSEAWRTTLRIIPWRAFTLKKWILVNG